MSDHRITTTDAEIEAAIERGSRYYATHPHATSVRYRRGSDTVLIELSNGVNVTIPRKALQGLTDATPRELANVALNAPGTGISWPLLDVDHSVRGVLAGVFGTRQWIEQRREAGRASTPAKRKASRANGKKGGRPKRTLEASV